MPASTLQDESPCHDGETWYERSFDALYPIVYAHRTVAAAAPEAQYAIAKTRLGAGDAALDLCCGNGRHLVHIARHTRNAIGLDFSAHLIQLAHADLQGHAHVLRGDMRFLPFGPVFDVVFNFFTSFGYFMAPADNEAVLRQIAAVLKPGGRFFMDYLNPAQVRATLVPHSTREQDGYAIEETRWIDEALGRVNKTTVVTRGPELVTRSSESVRLYERDTLCAMLAAAGLDVDEVTGGYDDAPHGPSQPRMILMGTRR